MYSKSDNYMKKTLITPLLLLISIGSAYASEFCDGFNEGYKTIKGNMVIVPICPIAPITPIGSTAFREGIKAGISAAQNN
jgi:hypothetical protein